MTRARVIEIIYQMPESFDLEDLFERLLFVQRLEERIRQAEAGDTMTLAEARRYLSRRLSQDKG